MRALSAGTLQSKDDQSEIADRRDRIDIPIRRESLGAKLGLFTSKSNASSVAAEVLCSIRSKCTPAASDIEIAILWLEFQFMANEGQLVVLQLFQSLLFRLVPDYARCVNHAGTEEPVVKVVAAVINKCIGSDKLCNAINTLDVPVVMISNLLFILAAGVHYDIWKEARKDVVE